jgi:lysophospholipase L1-like esterase
VKQVFKVAMLALAVFVGLSNCTSPASAEPIKILMMGDSITAGGYYITTLQSQLTASGYSSTVIGKCAGEGWFINTLDSHMDSYLAMSGVNQSNTYILLLIGTNDVGSSDTMGTAPTRLCNLISDIKTTVPLANVVVGNLTPRMDYAKDRIPVFNAAFATAAQNLHNSGVDFTVVDMFTPMNVNPSYYLRTDGVHPNTEYGHPLMAGVWYGGIVVPEPGCATLLGTGAGGLLLGKAWRRWRCARSARRF